MKLKLLITIITCCFYSKVTAQDPIFTQYFLVPETLNPGFSGFMETTYAGIIHREQWPDLDLRVDTDYAFVNTWSESLNSGLGLSVLNQRENLSKYNYTQVNANYAYRVRINDDWYFRPGIEAGFGLKSFAFQNLLLEDQINIRTGAVNSSSADPLLRNDKVNFFDVSAGMVFNTDALWIGLSMKHLNRPNIAFSGDENVPLETFFSLSSGYEFRVADYIDVQFFPYETKMFVTSNYMQQGRYNRLDVGASVLFERMFFGATAVTNPSKNGAKRDLLTSVNLFTGLQYEHLKLGFSYDINTSGIGKTGGVYELLLTYQFNLDKKCFGCPNYAGN
ncbi:MULTISPECIES: type IX secretion system membrane protein PorP/SprF [Flavobacterium]|uniref:Type IX secretion system membrane protein PorP/SprF n=1 Tax=Flavobacterium cupriresistens TaxID=2893885 RepID=A0ABU4R5L5_9FLAO|nr:MULTISPECIES: type IX secretion system membrane protein PorP/SprF [unclassified Flavobacterium]KLT71430.1 membrane protein [Flavobacterium sp. ABG]MDX6187882.1 type IX secretion system membrane protein PorP/SprF [Flavobacterium sp. Fl-318]UFH42198.1 type IX secretion system membrane protein PorP/SprF [Flavobacterium sp. F-323]